MIDDADDTESACHLRRLDVPKCADESEGSALARVALRPTVNAARTTIRFSNVVLGAAIDINDLVHELSEQCAAVSRGDLRRPEALLTAQAHTLDAIFNKLATVAAYNMSNDRDTCDRYLRLALKAQSQCRRTLETLAAIRNPSSVAYVKQANIAHGPQQVNNFVAPPRTGDIKNEPNELLEAGHGERLDAGAKSAAISGDSELEAVGPVDGATNR